MTTVEEIERQCISWRNLNKWGDEWPEIVLHKARKTVIELRIVVFTDVIRGNSRIVDEGMQKHSQSVESEEFCCWGACFLVGSAL